MKHFKSFGLLAVAVVAIAAFATSASADYVTTNTGGSASTPNFHIVNEGGHIAIANAVANIYCSSTIEGVVNSHKAGENVSATLVSLLLTGCTNSWHVTAAKNIEGNYGTLFLESTGGHNGHVYSTASRIAATRFGITCTYETNNTTVGSFTGGNPGTLHIEGGIRFVPSESSGLCSGGATEGEWEGDYVMTSSLYVGNS